MTVKRIIRSIIAIIIGIAVISIFVEAIEYVIVTLINREPATDPEVYYSIRNRGWFLGIKLFYNTLFAAVGGFTAATVAGYAPLRHGFALGFVQTIAFGLGLIFTEGTRWTPGWMWAALIVLTFGGILLGARVRANLSTMA